ncbi:MAG TPA: signal peptidase II [Verrucomicrobiota bacterium]|nr:signal peptidase II [Verrucomicrobiota bacterium]HNU52920.1 signal peptidase II [Verrucomicrobiota bacterium]
MKTRLRLPAAAVRIVLLALLVYVADQVTKLLVLRLLSYADQRIVIDGFFKFVHWGNTGAAWSLFYGNNTLLAVISVFAVIVLLATQKQFQVQRRICQIAYGLIYGGILGNLTDRLRIGHVIDFFRFYLHPRGGDGEVGFPAFNIADSAICVGVFLLFWVSWRKETGAAPSSRSVVAG